MSDYYLIDGGDGIKICSLSKTKGILTAATPTNVVKVLDIPGKLVAIPGSNLVLLSHDETDTTSVWKFVDGDILSAPSMTHLYDIDHLEAGKFVIHPSGFLIRATKKLITVSDVAQVKLVISVIRLTEEGETIIHSWNEKRCAQFTISVASSLIHLLTSGDTNLQPQSSSLYTLQGKKLFKEPSLVRIYTSTYDPRLMWMKSIDLDQLLTFNEDQSTMISKPIVVDTRIRNLMYPTIDNYANRYIAVSNCETIHFVQGSGNRLGYFDIEVYRIGPGVSKLATTIRGKQMLRIEKRFGIHIRTLLNVCDGGILVHEDKAYLSSTFKNMRVIIDLCTGVMQVDHKALAPDEVVLWKITEDWLMRNRYPLLLDIIGVPDLARLTIQYLIEF